MTKEQKHKSGHRSISPVIFIIPVVLGAIFSPSAIIVVIGLLPTLGAFLIDQDRNKSATMTVGLMNLSGVIPQLIDLWSRGQTFEHSLEMIRQPMVWIVMYCAAGLGWLIYYSVPNLVQIILIQRAKMRISDLEAREKTLVQQWGDEVKSRSGSH